MNIIINNIIEIRVFLAPKNTITERKHNIMIMPYSAIIINANNPPWNSILKPETISDSPSAKSNGVRFVSALQIVSHRRTMGADKYIILRFSCISLSFTKLYEVIK